MQATVHTFHSHRRSSFIILPPGLGRDHEDRVDFEKLRASIYCQKPLEWEPMPADGRERDRFDDDSIYGITKELRPNGKLVTTGGCRFVHSPHKNSPLPMEVRGECDDLTLERPGVEISRMMRVRKQHPQTVHALYRGIYATLTMPRVWGSPIASAYATIEPFYLTDLQDRFSNDVFVQMGDKEIVARTGTGKPISHVRMRINIAAWGVWYKHHDVEGGEDVQTASQVLRVAV